jgi:hypothetical protein
MSNKIRVTYREVGAGRIVQLALNTAASEARYQTEIVRVVV